MSTLVSIDLYGSSTYSLEAGDQYSHPARWPAATGAREPRSENHMNGRYLSSHKLLVLHALFSLLRAQAWRERRCSLLSGVHVCERVR